MCRVWTIIHSVCFPIWAMFGKYRRVLVHSSLIPNVILGGEPKQRTCRAEFQTDQLAERPHLAFEDLV